MFKCATCGYSTGSWREAKKWSVCALAKPLEEGFDAEGNRRRHTGRLDGFGEDREPSRSETVDMGCGVAELDHTGHRSGSDDRGARDINHAREVDKARATMTCRKL